MIVTSLLCTFAIFTNHHYKCNRYLCFIGTFSIMYLYLWLTKDLYIPYFFSIIIAIISILFYRDSLSHKLTSLFLLSTFYLCSQSLSLLINNDYIFYIIFTFLLISHYYFNKLTIMPYTRISVLLFASIYSTCLCSYCVLIAQIQNAKFPFIIFIGCIIICSINSILLIKEYTIMAKKIINESILSSLYTQYQKQLQKQIHLKKEEKQSRYLRHDIINYLQTIKTKQLLEGQKNDETNV